MIVVSQEEALKYHQRIMRQRANLKKYHQSKKGKEKLRQAQRRYYLKKKAEQATNGS